MRKKISTILFLIYLNVALILCVLQYQGLISIPYFWEGVLGVSLAAAIAYYIGGEFHFSKTSWIIWAVLLALWLGTLFLFRGAYDTPIFRIALGFAILLLEILFWINQHVNPWKA